MISTLDRLVAEGSIWADGSLYEEGLPYFRYDDYCKVENLPPIWFRRFMGKRVRITVEVLED